MKKSITTQIKILLIEDEPVLLSIYTLLLEKVGYNVTQASDGVTGLELMKKSRYDLVLLDIMLPRLDGIGVLEEIQRFSSMDRAQNRAQSQKVVLLTNIGEESILRKAQKLGVFDNLMKSDYGPDTFVKQIQSYMRQDFPQI